MVPGGVGEAPQRGLTLPGATATPGEGFAWQVLLECVLHEEEEGVSS